MRRKVSDHCLVLLFELGYLNLQQLSKDSTDETATAAAGDRFVGDRDAPIEHHFFNVAEA